MSLQKAALLSVSNRDGLIEFAKELKELGYVLLTTTGTAKHLETANIESTLIEDYTGQKEILDGRVKTLHPKIHAGLLAKRDKPDHMKQLEDDGILEISVVAVNLYPFVENLKSDKANDFEQMIELVDIGGPTMIRSASKNFKHIYTVIDPSDYPRVVEQIKKGKNDTEDVQLKCDLAVKVFTQISNYNLQIAKYFSGVNLSDKDSENNLLMNPVNGSILEKTQDLRYGENPHQKAVYYSMCNDDSKSWEQLSGKELSYNNFLDFDATARIIKSMPTDNPAAVIVKHLNPCGASVNDSLVKALENAKKGDPRSHFGGIIALNRKVDVDTANEVVKDFAEIVLAPDFEDESLEVLKKKKNLRIIKVSLDSQTDYEMRSCAGGVLVQQCDNQISSVEDAELVSKRALEGNEKTDLGFAWNLCQHVKSNAIVLVKDNMLLTSGAGQMSRIDSVEIAINKAKTHDHDLTGAVAASDAFFPFPDNVEVLAAAGIKAIIVTGGAMQDEKVIKAANDAGISLMFTADRHFRH